MHLCKSPAVCIACVAFALLVIEVTVLWNRTPVDGIARQAEKVSFWQLSDIHWDYLYNASGDPSKMCHSSVESRQNDTGKVSPFGTYSCESPWSLVELTVRGMAELNMNPDFIIWTGDNTAHFESSRQDFNWSVVFSSLKRVAETLRETFPDTRILPILGNHDAYLPNQYPDEPGDFYQRYLTEGGLSLLLNETEHQTSFARCGYYSTELRSLKIIVLNTNLYNIPDNYTRGKPDPCGQFEWLESELKEAEASRRKVLITAHIPPGYFERSITDPFYEADKNDRYVSLIQRYGNHIAGQIYGHTHTDSFRVILDKINYRAHNVAFMAPSVSPWLFDGGINPGIRLYQANSDHIQDYWQYYLNLTTAEASELAPQWTLLYRATETYNLRNLGPENMAYLYRSLSQYPVLFEKYHYYNTAGHVYKQCNNTCVREHLCAITHLSTADMVACLAGKNLYLDSSSSSHHLSITVAMAIAVAVTIALVLIVIGFSIFLSKLYRARKSQMELPLISGQDSTIND